MGWGKAIGVAVLETSRGASRPSAKGVLGAGVRGLLPGASPVTTGERP